jgi:hypothetical protein
MVTEVLWNDSQENQAVTHRLAFQEHWLLYCTASNIKEKGPQSLLAGKAVDPLNGCHSFSIAPLKLEFATGYVVLPSVIRGYIFIIS